MSEETPNAKNAVSSSDGPLAKLMSHSSMHIDLAACIRNLLWGIAAILVAAQQPEIDISALLGFWPVG